MAVWYANDANAAAFGEKWVGSGRRFASIVLPTLGTGVGGGIIIGDLSVDGENSCGSECGHIIIDYHESARMCGCGQRGHLEAYASATAVNRRAQEALAAGGDGSLARRVAAGETISPLLIAEEAEAGDAFSAGTGSGYRDLPWDRHHLADAHSLPRRGHFGRRHEFWRA